MIDPKKVAVQVALRSLQLQGSSQSQLETAYTTGFTALDGKQVPASALKDACVAVEAEIHEIIANDENHPYRAAIKIISAALASGAEVPVEDGSQVEFIGVYSGVIDASDGLPLTEGAMQEIWRYLRKSVGRYETDIRKFKITKERIYHTRPTVNIVGCGFSPTVALARFSSSNKSPLPASLESLWVSRTLEYMAQEGWFVNEAGFYGNFAQSCIARLKRRDLNFPTLPGTANSPNPIID